MRKSIKAKDQYGPVIGIVEKKKREAAAEGLSGRPTDSGSKIEPDSTSDTARSTDTALALFRLAVRYFNRLSFFKTVE